MIRFKLLGSLAVLLLSLGSARAAQEVDGPKVLAAQASLAVGLIEHSIESANSANITVSPATLAAALALASLGATEQGKAAIDQCLGFSGALQGTEDILTAITTKTSAADPSLRAAVTIVFDSKLALLPGAAGILSSHRVHPAIADLDSPAAVKMINNWVKETTRGAIPTILDAPPTGGGFVSLGALAFKKQWKTAFELDGSPASFKRPDGSSVSVPTMHLADSEQKFRVDDRFAAVDLAYEGDVYRMVIIADRAGNGIVPGDLKALGSWLTGQDFQTGKGEVKLPKFSSNEGRDLMPVLNAMGLAPEGGFPGFTKDSVKFARIVQKTMIKVDENGTEAASATAAIAERSADLDATHVIADARFLFALRDTKTGLLLAAGLIGDPQFADE
ncbi:serpin family protein [Rhizobium lusitanum]|uniref:Serpin B n=1 Tax=Rhizobium lusitanum TaxID=293958 RepID=A0A7X0MFI0_9HYPH|nr:serpin family protein [Rhizobium lusitanum]MBB6487058.1 serpin B [Rhizobium lusitanum]